MFQPRFFDLRKRIPGVKDIVFLLVVFSLGSLGFASENEEGFRSIFNGKDLSGWDGDSAFWSVKNGAITGQTTPDNPAKENTFLIWRDGEVDDFELRLSYRVINGNSGVQYRSRDMGSWHVGGYQADLESGAQWTGGLYDEQGRGVLAARGQKTLIDANGEKDTEQVGDASELLRSVKKDDWNDYAISASGTHLIHKINGRVMCEVIDNDAAKGARSGIVALQIHAGPPMTVQFKDLRLKRLPLADKKKVVLVAGRHSHGRGQHEHNAAVQLLKSCLDKLPEVICTTYQDGWPKDPTAFDNADSILLFMDGGRGHPMIRGNGLQEIGTRMKQGTGLAIIHYAVEVPQDRGGSEMLDWIGGYYETGYSTNPIWVAEFKTFPEHPVARGIKPFKMEDEWYFNMRFREGMTGVTPLLKATPTDKVRGTDAAKAHPGRAETVAWCVERQDGGRGFGFTGGHFHMNWGDDSFRTLVLNAIYWTAKLEVPANGVPSSITPEFLTKGLGDDRVK